MKKLDKIQINERWVNGEKLMVIYFRNKKDAKSLITKYPGVIPQKLEMDNWLHMYSLTFRTGIKRQEALYF